MTIPAVKIKIKPNLKLTEPSLFRVIFVNDDVTPMQFVIESLVEHFDHSDDGALELTERIHEKGSAVVAVLPHEIAEQKGLEVRTDASNQGYPLQVKIESE